MAPDAAVRAVRRWLLACMAAVILAMAVGAITRLTESGLSITVWRPVGGVMPPLSDAAWQQAFESYQQIPEARTVHAGITLPQFKRLYLWEWFHRILARVAGLVIAAPFFYLLARGAIPRTLLLRLGSLPLLVLGQGVLGWYMVKSGLSGRVGVSQYRLVAHLALALLIYVVAAWTLLRDMRPADPDRAGPTDGVALGLAALVVLTILSGGFVAGTDAGHLFNTFPLMAGRVVPPSYWDLAPAWRNWFENPVAIQFNHRVLAMLVLVTVLGAWARYGRRHPDRAGYNAWRLVPGAVVTQVVLGIATLLLVVPTWLAVIHQLMAVVLLTVLLRAGSFGVPGGKARVRLR